MEVRIIREPTTTDPSNDHVCKYSAIGNPMYFSVSRVEYNIIQTDSYAISGTSYLLLEADSAPSDISQGDDVYVYGEDSGGNVIINGNYEVLWINSSDVVIDFPATNPTDLITEALINTLHTSKKEISVYCKLQYGAATNDNYEPALRRFSCDSSGVAKVYLNAMIKDYLVDKYDIDYTQIHLVESAAFWLNIYFRDVDEPSNADIVNFADRFYAMRSVNQLNTDNRMTLYEVYNYTDGVYKYSEAEFLTAFEKPVIFRGYPFSLCALMGQNDDTVYRRYRYNSGGLVTTEDQVMALPFRGVYSIPINAPVGKYRFDVYLVTGEDKYQAFLNIDDEDNILIIDELGNGQRIQ